MVAILLKRHEDVWILFKTWSFRSLYQRVDGFWLYFVRRCKFSSVYTMWRAYWWSFLVILSLRAWAVWKRDRRLGVSLISLITLTTVAEIYVTKIFIRDLQCVSTICHIPTATDTPCQVSIKPYPEFVGCFLTSANRIVYLDWVVLMIYEAGKHSVLPWCTEDATNCLPVILVLMIIPGIASCKIHTLFRFQFAHKLPFQISEEGILICITSYIATVRYMNFIERDVSKLPSNVGIMMYIYLFGKRRSARRIHCVLKEEKPFQ